MGSEFVRPLAIELSGCARLNDINGFRLVSVNNYVMFNARLGYRVLDTLTLSLTGQQLNAPRLLTNAGAPTERRLIAGATLRFRTPMLSNA